nr:MAG TPA: hypothetical protein [Caudoviricetes sp.]
MIFYSIIIHLPISLLLFHISNNLISHYYKNLFVNILSLNLQKMTLKSILTFTLTTYPFLH